MPCFQIREGFVLMALMLASPVIAQVHPNPFEVSGNQASPPNRTQEAHDTRPAGSDTEFGKNLKQLQEEYSRMVQREQALLKTIRELADPPRKPIVNRQQLPNVQQLPSASRDRILELEDQNRVLKRQVAMLTETNQRMKENLEAAMRQLVESVSLQEKAVNRRNEMHQVLFESLLNSQDAARQEVALVHLFACADKYSQGNEVPINIFEPQLLRRIGTLTDSDSERVGQLASKCLFSFSPEMAVERGIQFGPEWRPLEYYRASANTRRILAGMNEACRFEFEETPLEEVLEELRLDFNLPVKLHEGVKPRVSVTFACDSMSLATALENLLAQHNLDYVIADEQLMIIKANHPELAVNRTYNIRGLLADESDLANTIEILQQAVGNAPVQLTPAGDHVLVANTTEANHRRIQRQLGMLARQAKWYAN